MCIFCKISNKEIPSNILLENNEFMAFEDINPQAKIHIVVIPKNHFDSFNDITPNAMSSFTTFIQQLTKKLNLQSEGYRLITNIGNNGGQEVNHIHFHILGGEKLGNLI